MTNGIAVHNRWFLIVMSLFITLAIAPIGVSAQDEDENDSISNTAESELSVELPPPDLPASNQQGYDFQLEASSQVDLDAVAREAPVYELRWKEATANRAERIASNLGIDGEVVDRGNGTFDVSGDAEIFVSPELVQFYSTAPVPEGDLPEDGEAIEFALEWLRTAGLRPNDIDSGRIVTRSEETNRLVIQFLPLEPENLLSAYPSVVVTQGPTGVVLEASIRWPTIERYDLYQLRNATDAWREVQSGQAFVDVQLPEGVADENGVVAGEVVYSNVILGYTTSGSPGGRQFLQPVYIFTGRLTPENDDRSYRIRAYVSAVANVGAPVG
jgi:hypothetical protein